MKDKKFVLKSKDSEVPTVVRVTHETEHYVFFVPDYITKPIKSDESKMTKRKFLELHESVADMADIYKNDASKIFGVPVAEVTDKMLDDAKNAKFPMLYAEKPDVASFKDIVDGIKGTVTGRVSGADPHFGDVARPLCVIDSIPDDSAILPPSHTLKPPFDRIDFRDAEMRLVAYLTSSGELSLPSPPTFPKVCRPSTVASMALLRWMTTH